MAESLSQAEIEALLESLTSDGSEVMPPAEPVSQPAAIAPQHGPAISVAYEIYDFRRPDKFAKDQLRTLQMLHETFARLFASSLSAYLRVPVHVDLVSVEQIPYDEYMRSLTNSIITIFSMSPLTGQALLEVEFSMVLSMIDRLLGGPGSMSKSSAVLTDIERALTDSIIVRALKDFRSAWEGIAQFTPRRESMETQPQFVQIVPANDVVVSILFEIRIGEMRGAMSICIPYLLLKPITSRLSAQRWFASSVKRRSGMHAATLANRLRQTRLTAVARLGTAQLTVAELLSLGPGDVVPLKKKQSDAIDLMIEGAVKFRGQPGVKGRNLAVHIREVVSSPEGEVAA